jgi:hypothetical protein
MQRAATFRPRPGQADQDNLRASGCHSADACVSPALYVAWFRIKKPLPGEPERIEPARHLHQP